MIGTFPVIQNPPIKITSPSDICVDENGNIYIISDISGLQMVKAGEVNFEPLTRRYISFIKVLNHIELPKEPR